MVHKVAGWFKGYLLIRVTGYGSRRFVNLCRNHGIELWLIRYDDSEDMLYCRIFLKDFYRLRPIARKCKVWAVVKERSGFPFVIDLVRKRLSFFIGVCVFICLLFFLSSRIWGISIEGQSLHTRESLLKYLDSHNVYGGMAVKDVECNTIREDMRHSFEDISWVSVELRGSRILIKLKEAQLVQEKEKKEIPANLVAEDAGTVISIVTSKGTAKVRAGDKVKKNKVLISGIDKIIGDGDELIRKRRVRAEGKVVIESVKKYQDELIEKYSKKEYTGRKKYLYNIITPVSNVFFYNPLNNLETYKKYDIIREGGQIFRELSQRFPVYFWRQCFAEVKYTDAMYLEEEAKEILNERFGYYLEEQENNGYKIMDARLFVRKEGGRYIAYSDVKVQKEQVIYNKLNGKKE
ncbi:MAG: sporulation protein YqfD [Lachnospiraceae bacterium]